MKEDKTKYYISSQIKNNPSKFSNIFNLIISPYTVGSPRFNTSDEIIFAINLEEYDEMIESWKNSWWFNDYGHDYLHLTESWKSGRLSRSVALEYGDYTILVYHSAGTILAKAYWDGDNDIVEFVGSQLRYDCKFIYQIKPGWGYLVATTDEDIPLAWIAETSIWIMRDNVNYKDSEYEEDLEYNFFEKDFFGKGKKAEETKEYDEEYEDEDEEYEDEDEEYEDEERQPDILFSLVERIPNYPLAIYPYYYNDIFDPEILDLKIMYLRDYGG